MSEKPKRSLKLRASSGLVRKWLQPRLLLHIWALLGGLALGWVVLSATLPKGKPGPERLVQKPLLRGELRDFELAFPPRGASTVAFMGPAGETSLKAFRGKVVLVNVWATWCGPCLKEMPSLDKLQNVFDEGDFTVVAIAAEPRARERVAEFFKRLEVENLEIYTDETLRFVTALGGAKSLPISILYDAKGNEVGRLTGGIDWDSVEARALIQAVIQGQKIF